jgi:hypothetical protein
MKSYEILIVLSVFAITVYVIACGKNDRASKQVSSLSDAQNLARQTKGFYSDPVAISVKKKVENDQAVIYLSFLSPNVKPYLIKVFFEKSQYDEVNIEQGSYEILFMKNVLIINQFKTGQRYDFVVDNSELSNIKTLLPKDYLSKSAIHVTGISVFGSNTSQRDNPDISHD